MEADRRQSEKLARSSEPRADEVGNTTSTEEDAQADNDRRDAIGGLLAALATTATTATTTTTVTAAQVDHSTRQSATPPLESPISPPPEDGDFDAQAVKEEGASHSPNNARLPSIDANNTVFADASLNGQFMNSHRMSFGQEFLQPITSEQLEQDLPFPAYDMSMDPFPDHFDREPSPNTVKRVYEAFARLEFADGIFYLNTYQCELGRDQHAYRDALKRDREAKEAAEHAQTQPKSSSGKASQRSHQLKTAESQVQGSVVSEAGGFAGVDDRPTETYGGNGNGQAGKSQDSQPSDTSVVRPLEVLHKPQLAPYDYQNSAFYQSTSALPVPEDDIVEDEQPAPVTADHMPDPHSCPLIPIHSTLQPDQSVQSELDALKAISRRHVKVYWSYDDSAFYMDILGRNGAFLEKQWYGRGESLRLYSGATIQISAVQFTFRLPNVQNDNSAADEDSEILSEDGIEMASNDIADGMESGTPLKLKLKLNTNGEAANAQATIQNGEAKRRGPGRPPKNGIMSQREMKERERAEKEAKARAVNGETTPPVLQRKPSKTQLPKPEPLTDVPKQEKRKYTKRKREDGEEDVLPSIEGEEETPAAETPVPQPAPKRARTKSVSPPYKPLEECTPEDLARPPHNYAVLLYMVLQETGEITLRQIYKQMQSRWPYFKYVVDSDGWTSSVRHNLNQEVGKLFERGRKEGKGFTWLPKPNAMEEYQAQKNKRSNAPPAPKPRPTPQRPGFPPGSGQQLTWQPNSGPAPQQDQGRSGFVNQGPWQPQQNGGQLGPSGAPANGHMGPPQANGQRPTQGLPSNPQAHQPPPGTFNQTAPKWCPVTFEGLAVINRFEASMMSQLSQEASFQEKWRKIFASAKDRCLHGHPGSKLEGGETNEERTIMKHISDFVQRYKNPVFESFRTRTDSPAVASTTATASASAIPATNQGVTTSQASSIPQQQSTTHTTTPSTAPVHGHPQPSSGSQPSSATPQALTPIPTTSQASAQPNGMPPMSGSKSVAESISNVDTVIPAPITNLIVPPAANTSMIPSTNSVSGTGVAIAGGSNLTPSAPIQTPTSIPASAATAHLPSSAAAATVSAPVPHVDTESAAISRSSVLEAETKNEDKGKAQDEASKTEKDSC